MRLSFAGLSGLVVYEIKEYPFKYGTIYAFLNYRCTQMKLLAWMEMGWAFFTSDYREVLLVLLVKATGIIQCMSRKDNCWNNAVSEIFF